MPQVCPAVSIRSGVVGGRAGTSREIRTVSNWRWDPCLDWHARYKAEQDADRLRDVLAESTASDVKDLRLALARIVVEQRNSRVWSGNCGCSDTGKGCSGHVPETTKIARAALGLSELPDSPQVPLPPVEPTQKKRKKKDAA